MWSGKVEISDDDYQRLKWFAWLPTWIQDEFKKRYEESNADALPVEQVRKVIAQLKREK